MDIKASNMFYISNFNIIGGVETYLYELCRKYKDKDIIVVYKTGYMEQIERLRQYVPVIRHKESNHYV